MMNRFFTVFSILSFLLVSCNRIPEVAPDAVLSSFSFCGNRMSIAYKMSDVPVSGLTMDFTFSKPIDFNRFDNGQVTFNGCGEEAFRFSADPDVANVLHLESVRELPYFTKISVTLHAGENLGINLLDSETFTFTTCYDPRDKFPRISIEELFEKVKKGAFLYFWDHAHPVSGLARERKGSGDTVTSGGSGFGIMSIPVAVERGWISREEGAEHCRKIVQFLSESSERFHGAWPHWLDGKSGKAIAFSTYDNGADLVETAFMIQGLLTVASYFDATNETEKYIRENVDKLWREVEWNWFRQDGQDKLYWHWSPDAGWKMNMAVSGWNEALIVYVLAASSPTYPIDKKVYDEGWAKNGGMKNGKKFLGTVLPLGSDYGGPMFFAHYSFLGLDPRNLKDAYADYWEQNVAHATINHDYCAASKSGNGYSDVCWGLTASDYPKGYTASSPTNDRGTIAPTAALASFPYLPQKAEGAMEYFYYVLGDRLWGEYGFRDSFSLRDKWFADSYIAIDEGPIVVMMENHRTGLLWDCFMKNEDVRKGLDKLGFTY